MNNIKLHGLNPKIMLLPYPINSMIDDVDDDDETMPLYHVIVSQGHIAIRFLVTRVEPENESDNEFRVIKALNLSISNMDTYKHKILNKYISHDSSIVNKNFEHELYPFKIKLLKINVHNYNFVESNMENEGFIFENEVIYQELKNRINEVCKKMMLNPKINQS